MVTPEVLKIGDIFMDMVGPEVVKEFGWL